MTMGDIPRESPVPQAESEAHPEPEPMAEEKSDPSDKLLNDEEEGEHLIESLVQPTSSTAPVLPEVPRLYGVLSIAEMNEKLEREMQAVRERMTMAKEQLLQTVSNRGRAGPPRVDPLADLQAHFVRDTIADGTSLAAGSVFTQTWTLRNAGPASWPAGCCVVYIGGDSPWVNAAERTTNTTVQPILPGETFDFSITLTAPEQGKRISYWRMMAPTGHRFGHKIWVDINVETPKPEPKAEPKEEENLIDVNVKDEPKENLASSSEMIFPELDKESPVASMHAETAETPAEPEEHDIFSDVTSIASFPEDDDESFLTDEEYDILDASDEEFLAEAQRAVKK